MFLTPKVAVLESKLDIYEELSKEMLAKLESAVEKISEGNSQIASILAKHETKLEESDKSDQLLMKMISKVEDGLNGLEKKYENLQKMVWVVSISAGVVISLIQILPAVGLRLTPVEFDVKMDKTEILKNGSD